MHVKNVLTRIIKGQIFFFFSFFLMGSTKNAYSRLNDFTLL